MTNMKNKSFLKALSEGPLIADGAMGTELFDRGIYLNRSLEEVNITNPNLIIQIHKEYIKAGAEIIKTHTFAANRIKLEKYGLADKLEEINKKAVKSAKEAASSKVFVAGSIGPTGIEYPFNSDEDEKETIRNAYIEQSILLYEAEVDIFILESFRYLEEMSIALKVIKENIPLPVISLMAFEDNEKTRDSYSPEQVFEILKSGRADVIGANCFGGPKHVYNIIKKLVNKDIPIGALPGVGLPDREDDRMIYLDTPEYFGVYARRFLKKGVSLLGGCCGTGPTHIKYISNAARMMKTDKIRIISLYDKTASNKSHPKKSRLAKKIFRVYKERVCGKNPVPLKPENFVVSVEVNPPRGLDLRKTLEAAKMLRDGGVDVINIADGPRATVRMSNQAMGHIVQREMDMEVILHVCCRDRNLLGLQSDLLASHILGIRNLVIITGDPPKLGDYPHATAVFDLDSINLLRLVRNLNNGIDPSGKSMDEHTEFFCATGAEPSALNYERELKRLEQKKEAGAQFIMTQPVYDLKILNRFLKDTKHLDMPILLGIIPLASYRNAIFLHNEVPGIDIPRDILKRMEKVDRGPRAREEGIKIAQEMLLSVVDRVVGAYIMPPFGKYSSALKILAPIY